MKNLRIEEIKKGRLIGKKKEGYLNLYLYLGVHETLEKLLDIFVTLEYY